MVKTLAKMFFISVGGTNPKYPKTKKLTTNPARKILLKIPLYLIDFTGLLSSQGKAAKIAIPAAIVTNPKNFAVNPNKEKSTALNIA